MTNVRDCLQQYAEDEMLSNIQLARTLGVTAQTIGKWLSGKSAINPKNEKKIRELLSNYDKPSNRKGEEEKNYEPCVWSVSRVQTWLDNPWDFYCKYVKGLKRNSPWQDALDRGTVLHELLEKAKTVEDLEELMEAIEEKNSIFEEYNTLLEKGKKFPKHLTHSLKKIISDKDTKLLEAIEKKNPLPVLSEKGIEDGFRVARKYLEEYETTDNLGKVLETEKKIQYDLSEYLPNQSFVGYIDKVVKDNRGHIWLVDHKTYSNKPQFEELRFTLQANVYMWVMKNVYNVEVAGFIYDCINPKEVIRGNGYHFYQVKIPYNERIVNMVMENFLTTIEIILNNPEYNIYKESVYGTAFKSELVHGFEGQFKPKITGIEEED